MCFTHVNQLSKKQLTEQVSQSKNLPSESYITTTAPRSNRYGNSGRYDRPIVTNVKLSEIRPRLPPDFYGDYDKKEAKMNDDGPKTAGYHHTDTPAKSMPPHDQFRMDRNSTASRQDDYSSNNVMNDDYFTRSHSGRGSSDLDPRKLQEPSGGRNSYFDNRPSSSSFSSNKYGGGGSQDYHHRDAGSNGPGGSFSAYSQKPSFYGSASNNTKKSPYDSSGRSSAQQPLSNTQKLYQQDVPQHNSHANSDDHWSQQMFNNKHEGSSANNSPWSTPLDSKPKQSPFSGPSSVASSTLQHIGRYFSTPQQQKTSPQKNASSAFSSSKLPSYYNR